MPPLHPCFLAESTLGRLAKWLRLAGFDTAYDTHSPDAIRLVRICQREGRILLTRTQAIVNLADRMTVHITANAPVDQVGQVIEKMRLRPESLRPLTRCACCNCLVQVMQKTNLYGRVPEHVIQNFAEFKTCPQCRRIYWRGSHAESWLQAMDGWFAHRVGS